MKPATSQEDDGQALVGHFFEIHISAVALGLMLIPMLAVMDFPRHSVMKEIQRASNEVVEAWEERGHMDGIGLLLLTMLLLLSSTVADQQRLWRNKSKNNMNSSISCCCLLAFDWGRRRNAVDENNDVSGEAEKY
jgi:hypothetical protein